MSNIPHKRFYSEDRNNVISFNNWNEVKGVYQNIEAAERMFWEELEEELDILFDAYISEYQIGWLDDFVFLVLEDSARLIGGGVFPPYALEIYKRGLNIDAFKNCQKRMEDLKPRFQNIIDKWNEIAEASFSCVEDGTYISRWRRFWYHEEAVYSLNLGHFWLYVFAKVIGENSQDVIYIQKLYDPWFKETCLRIWEQ